MQAKICPQCKIEKLFCDFNKDKSRKDGLVNSCKDCKANYLKTYYKNNKSIIKARSKKYQEENSEHYKIYLREWKIKNKDYYKNISIERKNNRRKYMKYYFKNRLNNDEIFKLSSYIRTRLNLALKGNQKFGHTIELLGCSLDYFKQHIEEQFKEGMNWSNRSLYGWHLDHIYPLSSFNLKDFEEQQIACHWSNYQPLWAKENLEKGNK